MENKVSIIVPIYNGEDYLPTCLESLVGQTYPNIEIVLVDDGSTDQSGFLCDDYAEQFRNILVIHLENGGVSNGRNRGIEKATGEYILFVDVDDYVEPDMVEFLVTNILQYHGQISCCGIYHQYQEDKIAFPREPVKKVVNGQLAAKEVLINKIATAGPVGKLFSKKLFDENPFPMDLTIGEDAVAMIHTMVKADTVVFDTVPKYYYVHRENSAMTAEFSRKDLDLIYAYERVDQFINQQKIPLKAEAKFRLIWAYFHVLDKGLLAGRLDQNTFLQLKKYLKKNVMAVFTNPYVGKSRKLSMGMLLVHRRLYVGVLLFYRRKNRQ